MLLEVLNRIQLERAFDDSYLCGCQCKVLDLIGQLEYAAGNEFKMAFTEHLLPKGKFLLKAGNVSNHVWILVEGMAKETSTFHGKELINHFYTTPEFLCQYNSAINHTPSNVSLQLITPARLLCINWSQIHQLEKKYSMVYCIEQLVYSAYCEELVRHKNRLQAFTSTEYYNYLIENKPTLCKHAQLYDLATYLGIEPASLSRIRSQKPRLHA